MASLHAGHGGGEVKGSEAGMGGREIGLGPLFKKQSDELRVVDTGVGFMC
jgi:hypothetical protein